MRCGNIINKQSVFRNRAAGAMSMDRRKLAVAAAAVTVLGFILYGYMQALSNNHRPNLLNPPKN
ncbi:MAG: hypothetical protein SVU32_08940 [Candidatus Nanohaloarchaea archaeon]|nr:hypothetical protein [Candidatus Nanohaloarchaea archaeon]